jgi:hypothetical protein
MKSQKFILFLTFILPAVFCIQLVAEETQSRPQAIFPETTYEFQPVPDGTYINHDFKILNKGDAELLIKNVNTG